VIVSCQPNKNSRTSNLKENYLENEIIREQKNSEATLLKPYVILVSIDGFRYDYAQRYQADNLLKFDVTASKMISSFPTKTFPNHYAIVTGLYPGNNGLVSNSFYDRSQKEFYRISDRKVVRNKYYYKGTPLWVLASQQEMVTASMFWVGSEAPIQDIHPTYYFNYDGSITNQQRVNKTVNWLQLPPEKRPHFITLYFSITDDVGHSYGPNSTQIEKAVQEIDATIGNLIKQTEKLNLPINIIVVSDHGMIEVERTDLIDLSTLIPDSTKVSKSFPYMVYSENKEFIEDLYTNLKKDSLRLNVYLKSNIPVHYHYNKTDDRIGDLIIMPKAPYVFGHKTKPIGTSTHGFDPSTTPEMGAIFFANGDAFNKNRKIAPFENVDIFPLISEILELDYIDLELDGNMVSLKPILK
jgi:predicted AlkP superfamily pyrophosphatase or phosphodiesterase